jgi:molecular chaperone DnaK
MSTAVGIDLGTTFSVVAQVNQAGLPEVLPNAEGSLTTPSVVLFEPGSVVVGSVAKEALAVDPENVVQLVKRHMGSQWVFSHAGIQYGPEHVSALILRKLLQDASRLIGPIAQAVVTVPAYFNDAMRLATRRATEMAGVDVLGLLSEPTAAAIAFGYDSRPEAMTGVVVDFGGGTFDVTVMRFERGSLRVLGTGGDAYLGGANLDKALFDHFVASFADANGLDVTDPDALSIEEFTQVSQEWLGRANRAKHDLTARDRSVVALQAGGRTARIEVTREKFESLTRVLLDEMIDKVADVLHAAGLSPKEVGTVLAVGGSTRVPAVQQRLRALFGKDPDTSIRPDEAVAQGAALFAARRQLEDGQSLMLAPDAREYLETFTVADVAAHSLGVSVYDQPKDQGGRPVVSVVLARNTKLPCEGSRTFYTMRADERKVLVPIIEGDGPDPALCTRIGEVAVTDLPPGRAAQQPVTVTMRYNRDGILEVTAFDVGSGKSTSATIARESVADPAASACAAEAVRAAHVE